MHQEKKNEDESSDLLWDCFVNWVGIIERIEKEKKTLRFSASLQ
jgi:hypothetical protein